MSRAFSGAWLYHFKVSFTSINLNFFASSKWIIFINELCLFRYDVAAKFLQPDITWEIISGILLHFLQVSLSAVLCLSLFIFLLVIASSFIGILVELFSSAIQPYSLHPFKGCFLVYVTLSYHLVELTVKWRFALMYIGW